MEISRPKGCLQHVQESPMSGPTPFSHSPPPLPPKPTLTTSFTRSRQQEAQPCSRIVVRTPRLAGPSWSYNDSLGSSAGVARIMEFLLDICSIQNDSLEESSGVLFTTSMNSPNLPASRTPPIIHGSNSMFRPGGRHP